MTEWERVDDTWAQRVVDLQERIDALEALKKAAVDRAERHARHILSMQEDAKDHRARIATLEAALRDAMAALTAQDAAFYVTPVGERVRALLGDP